MRTLLAFIFGFILLGAGLTLLKPDQSFRTYPEVLKELVEDAPLKTYRNDFYGYTVRYPELFTYEEMPEDTGKGFARFTYHNTAHLIIECDVQTENEIIPTARKMEEMARRLRAEKQVALRDSFILSGPLYDEAGSPVDGYRYHTKFVRQQKLWFSYTVYYPESCSDSISSIIRQIDDWQVWDRRKPICSIG